MITMKKTDCLTPEVQKMKALNFRRKREEAPTPENEERETGWLLYLTIYTQIKGQVLKGQFNSDNKISTVFLLSFFLIQISMFF